MRRFLAFFALLGLYAAAAPPRAAPLVHAQTDLDAFMQRVLARRDENWKKLQQYMLEERERVALVGPDRKPLWTELREYMWYIRDGFFIRSPLTSNGVAIGEENRRAYEAEFLRREERRERRLTEGQPTAQADAALNKPSPGLDGLLRQTRQPGFISSAYFLRFRFEEGKYGLVGHETLDGRDTLRIEYYPARLFYRSGDRQRARSERGEYDAAKAREAEMERMLNKVSLVTLWIDPGSHQILKYTFANVDFDFMPIPWILRIDDLSASMTMGQPFPEVWLPQALNVAVSATVATGQIDLRYGLEYHDYRLAGVTSKVGVPGDR